MPTEQEYRQRITNYNWIDLQNLWSAIKNRNTPNWGSGKAFEYFILKCFEWCGAEVVYPFSVRLFDETVEQIDGVIYLNQQAFIIECKDFTETASVNFEPIAKLRNQLMRRPASTIGCVFSNSGYTYPAVILANFLAPQSILLWEQIEIEYCLNNQNFDEGLILKYKKLVELGIPDYSINTFNT